MNIIYWGNNIKLDIIKNIKLSDNFIVKDLSDYLILDFKYYKKKYKTYILDKLQDSKCSNFLSYKKEIIFLNFPKIIYIQKYIKDYYYSLSQYNKIIIITERLPNIINELINSFHIIYIRNDHKLCLYDPLKIFVNQTLNIYNNDLEPLTIEKIEYIKSLSYKICKYDIPIKLYLHLLLDKITSDPKRTFKLKCLLVKLITNCEYNINKSYRLLIHIETLLINIYTTILTYHEE